MDGLFLHTQTEQRMDTMTLELSLVADVFRHEAQAKHALEALRQAGFGYDQIGIAMQGHEGIDLQRDLQNLGLSYEQASYYAQEVQAGHTVVSVRPDGREREAHEIMRRSGAFTDADGVASQMSDIDTRRAAWEQAEASHQVYLAEQRASQTQEDFHRPRSLKPRADRGPVTTERVQTEDGVALVTEQKLSIAPAVQQEDVTEKKLNDAPVVQQEMAAEQPLLIEEQHQVIGASDDEDTLRRPSKHAPSSGEALPPQMPLQMHTNRKTVQTGLRVGGLLLAVGAGVLLAVLRGEQIREFVLSTLHTVQKQRATLARRNRDDH